VSVCVCLLAGNRTALAIEGKGIAAESQRYELMSIVQIDFTNERSASKNIEIREIGSAINGRGLCKSSCS
jgi:hypothetical protein